jgi:hypothetical protein
LATCLGEHRDVAQQNWPFRQQSLLRGSVLAVMAFWTL